MSENPLTRTLAREAERLADSDAGVSVDGVLARAGEIRRGRRMRASLVMAAVVLAVAVPVGVKVLDGTSPAPKEPTPVVTPDSSPLSLTGLDIGAQPENGFASDALHGPSGTVALDSSGQVRSVARMDGGFLVASTGPDGDIHPSSYVDPDLYNIASGASDEKMDGGFAVSPRGRVGAYTLVDGTVVVVERLGQAGVPIGRVPTGTGFDTVAVAGESCLGAKPDCTVYVTSTGEIPANWAVSPGQEPVTVSPQLRNLRDVSVTGDRLGTTAVHDDLTTCSAVFGDADEQRWSTCPGNGHEGRRLLSYSPVGRLVLATGSVGSGLGDSELAILDAATGKAVLDLTTAQDAVITSMVWEDDEHVLALIAEHGKFGVVRIGVDGRRSLALPAATGVVTSDPEMSPYVLAVR